MLAFIDVSGDPYAKPKDSTWTAIHIVCIRKSAISDITVAMHRFKRDILNDEYKEMKSTELINPSTLNHPDQQKAKYLERIIEVCIDRNDCKHAAIIFKNTGNNKRKKDKGENYILPRHYRDALWRVEAIAENWNIRDVVVIIDNDLRSTDKSLAIAFNNYLYRTEGGKSLKNILPVPIFADSETTAGLQLADISAGIMRHYYLNSLENNVVPSCSYKERIAEYYSFIKRHSIDGNVGGYHIKGIYCPKEYRI